MIKAGVVLGKRYEVMERIGAGGMADVYKGKDEKLNRYVAIKVLKRQFREDDTFVKKFQTEAQSAAGLMHPNVVNVYDVGVDRGLYYIVMELVEGITLKDYIEKKGRLNAKEVISIAIQICAGINAAHQNQIIHRDIKPQNVIISKEGKVKVTDFGIAKAATSQTVSTNVLGSVHYTSPEQARGGISDAKSDIYSLGITLYEMVTGQVPFDGDSAVAVAVKHLNEEIIPPSNFAIGMPRSLEKIILKCTQKSPDRRYQNMTALIADLKRSLVDPDGDFVVIPSAENLGDTMMASSIDIERARREAAAHYETSQMKRYSDEYDDDRGYDDDYDEHYDRDDYDDDYDDRYDDKEYDDRDYDDHDYDDDEDDYDYDRRNSSRKNQREDVNPGMTKVIKILTAVITAIIIFVLIFIGAKAAGLLKFNSGRTPVEKENEDMTTMPDIVGKKQEDAIKLLNEAGLGYQTPVKTEESEKYDKGYVIKADYKTGDEVKKNTRIVLTVSSGLKGAKITMPDLADYTVEDARTELVQLGIKEGNITPQLEASDTIENGKVIRTDPIANAETTKDAKIILYVSKGKEQAEVPKLVGKDEETAKKLLQDAGLKLGGLDEEYSNKPVGTVISQSIDAGQKVDKDTPIDIVLSMGERPKQKPRVPDIVGNSEANVRNSLSNMGLVMTIGGYEYSDKYPAGQIISCNPGEGTEVDEGTTITVIISKGPKPAEPSEPTDPGTGDNTQGTE